LRRTQYRRVLDPLDAVLAGAGLHEFQHRELRHGEALAAGLDEERGDDGQRQRDLDRKGGADAGRGLQIDRTADLLDVGTHDIHADAASGNAGHIRGGGKARPEDEVADFRIGLRCDLGFARQSEVDGLGPDAVEIEAAAVIGDLDDDVPALVAGAEGYPALGRLAGGTPLRGALDAMIRAIADEVSERILDQLQHLAVELGLSALHFQVDLFAELGRQVAYDAWQLLPGVADRLHARLHHAFLQLGGDVGEPLQRRLEVGVLVPADDFEELVAREHQLGNGGHEPVERVDVDADRLARHPFARLGVGALARRGDGRVPDRGGSSNIGPLPLDGRRGRVFARPVLRAPV